MAEKISLELYDRGCTPIVNKVKEQIDSMKEGDILIVEADNRCALKKLRHFCYSREYTLDIRRIDDFAKRYIITKS